MFHTQPSEASSMIMGRSEDIFISTMLNNDHSIPGCYLSCFLTLPLCFFDVCDTDVTSSHHICNRSTLPRHSSNIDSYICVNISERKAGQSGRKSVKAGVSMYSTARGHKLYCSTSSRRYTDFARATVSLCPALSLFRALCGPDKLTNMQTHNILQLCTAN